MGKTAPSVSGSEKGYRHSFAPHRHRVTGATEIVGEGKKGDFKRVMFVVTRNNIELSLGIWGYFNDLLS